MSDSTLQERFKQDFFNIWDETFAQHQGVYLDKNTSLFETLDTITAAEASRPVSSRCASLAAQVEHTRFYIDVMEKYILGQDADHEDWGEIWRTVREVTPEQWEASKTRLTASYQRVLKRIQSSTGPEGERALGGGLAILVHTAYHLGEIRQALCTLKEA